MAVSAFLQEGNPCRLAFKPPDFTKVSIILAAHFRTALKIMGEEQFIKEVLGAAACRDLELLKRRGLLKRFYLAGGTGAALQLFHRRSKDLDFFSPQPFSENLLVKNLGEAGRFELEKKAEGTVIGQWNKTKLSFFYYPYPLLKKPKIILGMRVADLIDIACMKIDAIAGRGSKKDFIDVYTIIQVGHSLEELLGYFKKKYAGTRYNTTHIQKGLAYFGDADREKEPFLLKPLKWSQIKIFFQKEVQKSANSLFSYLDSCTARVLNIKISQLPQV